jgi:Na+/proline symporter
MALQSQVIALLSVVVCCTLYLWVGGRESQSVRSLTDYLPLRRYLNAHEYRGTTVAAGMSLATVLIALVNLSPLMGVALFVTVITYAGSFGLLYFAVPRILMNNPENRTVPGFLGHTYNSTFVERVAGAFTLIGYLSIFAMELLVGVTVLAPFFERQLLLFSLLFFAFLVTYTWLSGFRGVVATDKWQIRFILASILALTGYFIWSVTAFGTDLTLGQFNDSLFRSWNAPLAFTLGIAAMNLPAPFSDTGTWQRLCSSKGPSEARRGLKGAILLFIFLWSALILVGLFHSVLAGIRGGFDPTTTTLMNELIEGMAQPTSPILAILLFIFMLGLFSAMVSTAEALLLSATHIIIENLGIRLEPSSTTEEQPQASGGVLTKTRNVMLIIATLAFALFGLFRLLNMNVVELVFAIYGAQIALFPATIGALYLSRQVISRVNKVAVALSVAVGYAAAWACALTGQVGRSPDLLFYAPLVGLVVSGVIFSLSILSRHTPKPASETSSE